ncbi:fimbria/pilus outer membrane usher protein [Halomonas denitrificans]|nr:fimbria/pilus outer membrane usher protein [Halomonas denitrificans]
MQALSRRALGLLLSVTPLLATAVPAGPDATRSTASVDRTPAHGQFAATVAAATLPGPSSEGGSSPIVDIRFGQDRGRTRLVIETTRPIDVEVEERTAEAGLAEYALDIAGISTAELRNALPVPAALPGPWLQSVDAIQSARDSNGRIALKFLPDVSMRSFRLAPMEGFGHRLVFDFSPPASSPVRNTRPQPPSRKPVGMPTSTDTEAQAESPREDFLWVEAGVNQRAGTVSILVLRDSDGFLVAGDDLLTFGLAVPDRPDRTRNGREWFSLQRMGIAADFDPRRLTLELTAPANAFEGNTITPPGPSRPVPTPTAPGLFLNYDVTARRDSDAGSAGALLELGAFGRWGSLTSDALAEAGSGSDRFDFVRLETRFRRDDPASLRTLELGDTVTGSPEWAGNVRFGGIRWGNNFDLHPQLVTTPFLSLDAEAELPSTIELYVDDALRFRDRVDPGPFDIERIPLVTGTGEARLVITDLLGRQRVITRSFYARPEQLREGLSDWNVSFGRIRERYGSTSFDYGPYFAAVNHRYGLTDRATAALHAHLVEGRGAAGAGMSWLAPFGGLMTVDAAWSHGSRAGSGWQASLGLQRQTRRFFGSIQARWATEGFRRLGADPDRELPSRELFATVSAREILGGSLGLSLSHRDQRDRPDLRLATLRYSRRIDAIGFVNLAAVHDFEQDDLALDLRLTVPLSNPRTSLALGVGSADGRERFGARVRRNLPVGPGFGYELEWDRAEEERLRASLAWQTTQGRWTLEAARRSGRNSGRISAAGGLVWMADSTFASLPVRDSFAVARVGDFEDVRVYLDHQLIGRTGADGRLLIPGLRPYERNRLRVEQGDLPIGADIDDLETEVVPNWRSGTVADFPIRRSLDARFRVVLDSGRPPPPGTRILDGNGRAWAIGREGRTFVSGLSRTNRFTITLEEGECIIELHAPPSQDPLLDLGTQICRSQ